MTDVNGEWDYNEYTEYVTFPTPFVKKPQIQVVMKEAELHSDGNSDGYGWEFPTSQHSKTGFRLVIRQIDRYFYKTVATWIACM